MGDEDIQSLQPDEVRQMIDTGDSWMVMTKIFRSAFLCLLLTALLSGCSGDQEKKEVSAIEKMTDKAAEEAVQNIRQPLERAEQVQAIQDARTRAINEAVKNSSQ